jgi:hypothetical protein
MFILQEINTGDSRYTHFRYPRFYFSIMRSIKYPTRGQILKSVTCVEPCPGLSGNVMQMISLASKNYGASLTSKWQLLYVSRFTRFRYTRRLTGMEPPCISRVTCTRFKFYLNCCNFEVSQFTTSSYPDVEIINIVLKLHKVGNPTEVASTQFFVSCHQCLSLGALDVLFSLVSVS